jgi:hypothetical protein
MIGIDSCHRAGLVYTGQVRLNWRFPLLAVPVTLALLGAGCAGINTTQSVSPIDFFLPGAGHFLKVEPPATNGPAVFPEIFPEVALNN